MRTAIEIYEEFDLELPVNTINFVLRPGPVGVGAVTLVALFAVAPLVDVRLAMGCGSDWLVRAYPATPLIPGPSPRGGEGGRE